jgi:hypothetical protein
MPSEIGRLDQARDRRSALTRGERSGEEPVLSSSSPGPDLSIVMLVVDGQPRVLEVAHERRPTCTKRPASCPGYLATTGVSPLLGPTHFFITLA